MKACTELAAVAARLASETDDPREFLRRLGTEAAGIRRGPLGFVDLARGGSNLIPGGGVKRRFDDDTDGQIRHFAGMAAAVERMGARAARGLSITVMRDPPSSADGRLTDAALRFATSLIDRSLAVDQASRWIDSHVCA